MSLWPFPAAPSVDARVDPIDAVIERALTEQRLVGAVVLVAQGGRLIYQRAAGWADRESSRPMREDTPFRLASISKPIIATACMRLVEQGRLALDQPISRWLPWFQPRLADGGSAQISLRQLLNHTSGLGYRFLESDAQGPLARAGVSDGMDRVEFDLHENLRRLASVPLLFEPGSRWYYSLSYDVLGALIEQAHGTPLDQAVRELIVAPLGLDEPAFQLDDSGRLAAVYVSDLPRPQRMHAAAWVAPFPDSAGIAFDPARAHDAMAFPSGGAGMLGSAPSFLRLLECLRQGGAPLLDASSVAEMGRDQTAGMGPPDAPGYSYGLGYSVLREPSRANSPESPGTWRWGGAYGHSWFVDPVRELSVVAFSNTLFEGMSGPFVNQLRDAVYAAIDGSAGE